jgi:limonene-1,2-epoxide hydrolase
MSEFHEKQVAGFLATFHAGALDLAKVASFLAPDVRYQPIVPLSRAVEGRDAVCGELDRQFRIYADCDCQIIAVASNGRQVFTERVDTVRQLADGRQTVVHVTGVFDVGADGLITFWREYWDAIDVARQMSLTMDEMATIMCTDAPQQAAA